MYPASDFHSPVLQIYRVACHVGCPSQFKHVLQYSTISLFLVFITRKSITFPNTCVFFFLGILSFTYYRSITNSSGGTYAHLIILVKQHWGRQVNIPRFMNVKIQSSNTSDHQYRNNQSVQFHGQFYDYQVKRKLSTVGIKSKM